MSTLNYAQSRHKVAPRPPHPLLIYLDAHYAMVKLIIFHHTEIETIQLDYVRILGRTEVLTF